MRREEPEAAQALRLASGQLRNRLSDYEDKQEIATYLEPRGHYGGALQYEADGLAWTGSSLTVWKEDEPNVIPQIELMKAAYRHQVPSFGSCWAAQIGAVAAGGRCAAHPHGREMGIARKIILTEQGRGHPLYHGKAAVFDAFISHDDEVTHLPPGAVCLASNAYTRVQAVAITHQGGTLWAVQYHPEYDLHELARLMHCRTQKLIGLSFFADEADAATYIARLEALHSEPTRKDLAWQLGIDSDVMNVDVRTLEVRNWIEQLVLPNMRR
jgi:GMP synthase (glutamine-hydrolysing)